MRKEVGQGGGSSRPRIGQRPRARWLRNERRVERCRRRRRRRRRRCRCRRIFELSLYAVRGAGARACSRALHVYAYGIGDTLLVVK